MGERGEHRLGRGVDGAAGAVVTTPGRLRRVEDLGRGGALEDGRHLADFLRVDPAHHVGHGATVERRRDEERRQELGCGGVPELPVAGRALTLGRLAQLGGGPTRLMPLAAAGQGRPGAGPGPRAAGRVDAPHLSQAGPRPQRVPEEVALDAGGHDGSLPAQDGRHGQARGLPALGGPDHDQGLGRLGRQARSAAPRRAARRGGAGRKACPSAATSSGRRSRRLAQRAPLGAALPWVRSGPCLRRPGRCRPTARRRGPAAGRTTARPVMPTRPSWRRRCRRWSVRSR